MSAARPRGVAGLVLACVSAVALAACATGTPSASPPASVPPSDAPSGVVEVASPVTGVVVAIESSGLEDVTGFTLRTGDGVQLGFRIAGPLENAAEFPLGHLGSHVATSEPVRVFFRRTGGALLVYRIEDAG